MEDNLFIVKLSVSLSCSISERELTLNSKRPPNHPQPKLLNIYKTAYTSPIPTNDTFLELSGQDL